MRERAQAVIRGNGISTEKRSAALLGQAQGGEEDKRLAGAPKKSSHLPKGQHLGGHRPTHQDPPLCATGRTAIRDLGQKLGPQIAHLKKRVRVPSDRRWSF